MKYLLLYLLFLQPVFAVTVDLDQRMPDPMLYVRWDDGKATCIRFPTETGTKFNTPAFIAGETLQQYVERSWEYQPFPPILKTRCDAMSAKYAETWTVVPLSSKRPFYPKPVYALQGFPGKRKEIGRVRPGTPCGAFVKAYSKTIRALTWRRVTVNGVTGVTVCKK